MKTEAPIAIVENTNGARTEIIGGLICPVHDVPTDVPAFVNVNAALSLNGLPGSVTSAKSRSYNIVVKETNNGVTKLLYGSDLPSRDNSFMIPRYIGLDAGSN